MVSNSAKLDCRTKQHTESGVSTSDGSRDMARTRSRWKKKRKKRKKKKMNSRNPIKHPLQGSLIILIIIIIIIVTRPPLERYLNWVPETTPTPPRDHGKENLPPVEEPRKLPRKMRPRRRKKEHHQHPGTSGNLPGTSQSPNPAMSASVKHPQPFQHPQHPQPSLSAANHNSAQPNLLDQAELGRLYKPASSSISKESTTRSRRDYFSGSNLSFTCSQRSHRDYFSGSPSGHLNKNWTLTDPLRGASIAVSERTDPAQTPPLRCFARRQAGRRGGTARSRCNLPHSMCGTPSSSSGDT